MTARIRAGTVSCLAAALKGAADNDAIQPSSAGYFAGVTGSLDG